MCYGAFHAPYTYTLAGEVSTTKHQSPAGA